MNQETEKPTIPIDESTLTRAERRRLERNRASGRQQQMERMGFIFARCMEQFRIEARREFDAKLVEEFIYRAFAPETKQPTIFEKIKIWWSTRNERAEFKKKMAGLEKLGKVKMEMKKPGTTIIVDKKSE